MKKIFVALVCFFTHLALADSVALDPLHGNWTVVQRVCTSGAPVTDGFLIGKDEMYISFRSGKYESHTRIINCNYWVIGNYSINGNMLRIFDATGASNCTHQVPPREGTVFFSIEQDKLNIYSGPFGIGGSCPKGDYLQTQFVKM